jgi:PEP-CTERM motif
MRTLICITILFLNAAPVFADAVPRELPEPSAIGLIGIGALAFLLGRRGKK